MAVKVLRKFLSRTTSTRQNLLQEARASSSLAHPNICTVHEVGETDGDSTSLWSSWKASPCMPSPEIRAAPETVLRYGVQISSALARAHDRGIVHRDLKTANIVVTPEGLVKVLDFGLAKHVGGGILDGPPCRFRPWRAHPA